MKDYFSVMIDSREKNICAEVVDKRIWFKIDDNTYSYELAELTESFGKKTKTSSKSADKITAPMPGKVTKIFVSEKQSVNKGEALLVMEAMKMEYTLKADLKSTVEKLNVKLDDQVSLGQLLIQLKENK